MEVQVSLKPEHIERLNKMAEESGRGTDDLIEEAIQHLFDYDEWFRAKVRRGLDDIKHGRLLESEEVWDRVERILKK